MKRIFSIFATLLLISIPSHASNVSSLSYAGTNVTTAAYVTFVASTPIYASRLMLCDSSGQILKIATGATAAEVDYLLAPLSGCQTVQLPTTLPSGTRLSLRAISASATTGFIAVSFLP